MGNHLASITHTIDSRGSAGILRRGGKFLRVVCAALCACSPRPATAQWPEPSIRFEDLTERSGIEFRHVDGSSGRQYLVEFMGAGVASLDYDRDGWVDVYFCNGHPLPQPAPAAPPPGNYLYRNLGGFRFRNVSVPASCDDRGYGLGAVSADYDNDGFADLYVTNFGVNTLLRNNGDGTFSDVTAAAGTADGSRFSAGANFLDVDADGDLDLFVGNYVDFSFARHARIAPRSYPYPPGPRDFPYLPDSLYLNRGDGTFEDASDSSGIGTIRGPSMGSIAGDFDGDGDCDIFVCCDGEPNHLFVNDGRGRFEELGVAAAVAMDAQGAANGSMGVDAADLNGDGIDDLLVTDYTRQTPMLFLSLAPGIFEDAAHRSRIGTEVAPHVNWSPGLVDFDNDGDADAFFCNGHFLKKASDLEPITDFRVRNSVMENLGSARFRSVTSTAGAALQRKASTRGAAFEDFDRDGRVDAVLLNCDDTPQVLRNVTPPNGFGITVRCIGRAVNRDGVGTRIAIRCGNATHSSEVRSGRGYQSHFGMQVHFGVAAGQTIDGIEVKWPDGTVSHRTVDAGSMHANRLVGTTIEILQPSR